MPFAQNISTAVLSAFVADSLALGSHWCYDSKAIESTLGSHIGDLVAPGKLNDYHKGKQAGDFTHYGDQLGWLLQYIVETGAYDRNTWSDYWFSHMSTYTGYKDSASKFVLENKKESQSTDLGGAVRMAPLLLISHTEEFFVWAAKDQAECTHNSPLALAATEFFARVLFKVSRGMKSVHFALREVAEKITDSELKTLVKKGLESESCTHSEEVITSFGKACDAKNAVPAIVHLLEKHGGDASHFETALIENVKVGGDSAARGIILASILGAQTGIRVPERWSSKAKGYQQMDTDIHRLADKLRADLEHERDNKEYSKRTNDEHKHREDQDAKLRSDRLKKLEAYAEQHP